MQYSLYAGKSGKAFLFGHELRPALLSTDTTGKNFGIILNTQLAQILVSVAVFQNLACAYQIDGVGSAAGSLCNLFSQHDS